MANWRYAWSLKGANRLSIRRALSRNKGRSLLKELEKSIKPFLLPVAV
jgi:hypothetical protein